MGICPEGGSSASSGSVCAQVSEESFVRFRGDSVCSEELILVGSNPGVRKLCQE